MANRIFSNVVATNPTADNDSTRKGAVVGSSENFLMYQTLTATDVELLSSIPGNWELLYDEKRKYWYKTKKTETNGNNDVELQGVPNETEEAISVQKVQAISSDNIATDAAIKKI